VVTVKKNAGLPTAGGPLFFACYLLILTTGLLCGTASRANEINHKSHQCAQHAEANIESVQVQHVTDGDTVVLSDNRRVRIIGINAPEMAKASERILHGEANAARDVINEVLAKNSSLQMVIGNEAQDQYGRTLAHLLLPNGENLATHLLARGLAAATAVSPNVRCAEYFLRIESVAREQARGVWQYAKNPWLASIDNRRELRGFHILHDTVTAVNQRRNDWVMELKSGANVVGKATLFSKEQWQALVNKPIEVRGWFGRHKGRTRVRLHHPVNLAVRAQQQ